jgi:hypothetical protein
MITAFVMIVVARFKGTRIEIRDLTAAIIADQERHSRAEGMTRVLLDPDPAGLWRLRQCRAQQR